MRRKTCATAFTTAIACLAALPVAALADSGTSVNTLDLAPVGVVNAGTPIAPPASDAPTIGPVGPISNGSSTVAALPQMFASNITAGTAATGSASTASASPDVTDGACVVEAAGTALGSSKFNFAGRVVCEGNNGGSTSITVCPQIYEFDGFYNVSGSPCVNNKGINGTSAGVTRSCAKGTDYRTEASDYVPEDIPSRRTADSNATPCT